VQSSLKLRKSVNQFYKSAEPSDSIPLGTLHHFSHF
jgi:hypothetical protein